MFLTALMLVTVFPSAGSLPVLEDDAGSGGDAGDTPGDATTLEAEGTYNGTLVPPDDADWFRLSVAEQSAPRCLEASVGGAALADVTLQADGSAITRSLYPGMALDLALAVPPGTQKDLLGLEPSAPPWTSSDEEASFGRYTFDLRSLRPGDLDPGDGGSDRDAGDTPETAVPVTDGCLAGALELGASDTLDVYTFEGEKGQTVGLSFSEVSQVTLALALVDPAGNPATELLSGGSEDVVLDSDGVWSLKVGLSGDDDTQVTSASYMLGFTSDDPRPPPCNPSCLHLLSVG